MNKLWPIVGNIPDLYVNSNKNEISSPDVLNGSVSVENENENIQLLAKENNFVEHLYPEKIRWFYKENKSWIPFCGYDSLRLETKFRELVRQTKVSRDSSVEKIIVRGDLFEVDVLKRKGYPIYWNAVDEEQESFPILRGSWFRESSWQPLESETLSDEVEQTHLDLYGLKGSNESMVDLIRNQISQKLHLNVKSMVINQYHLDWYDENTVFIYTNSASHFIRQKLGLTKVGCRIYRGYKHDARIEDKLPDITHLVFVVHGIGQKMKGGEISYQVSKIRSMCRKVVKKVFPYLEDAKQRVEFLPVEWRKNLILDGNTVELITPKRNRNLRHVLNSTALDILYYSSPIYRPEMIESLRSELNRLYSMFCSRNPYFEDKGGKVSMIAHSLGAVLVYDILTNWSPAKIYEYMETLNVAQKEQEQHEENMELFSRLDKAKEKVKDLEILVLSKAEKENTKFAQANFRIANFPGNFINGNLWKVLPKIDNLFCVGSPLSVFLALRGLKPQKETTVEHILPEKFCRRMFNIFHPADPVVYRMEPLINESYINIEPVKIYRLDHPKKVPYDTIETDLVTLTETSKPNLKSISERSFKLEDLPPYESHSSYSERYGYTFTGKIMKFLQKFKADTTRRVANSVVNQMVMSNEIVILDDPSENNSMKPDKIKKKNKHKVIFRHPHFLNQFTSFRQSKRSSWMDLTSTKLQRQSMRRFSEHHPKLKMEDFSSTNNWEIGFKETKKLGSKHSSDEESLKSSESDSLKNSLESLDENDAASPLEDTTTVSIEKELKYRIDFKLPESRYENSYLSVLTSHTSYWNSPELCMFILTQIFSYLGEIGNPL